MIARSVSKLKQEDTLYEPGGGISKQNTVNKQKKSKIALRNISGVGSGKEETQGVAGREGL